MTPVTCKLCGLRLFRSGFGWRHEGAQPRHPGVPSHMPDLKADVLDALAPICKRTGKTPAEVLREAIALMEAEVAKRRTDA